jgi:hypothetical protein
MRTTGARRQLDRALHLRVADDLGDADRRALARRLDHQRQAEHVGDGAQLLARLLIAAEADEARRRQPFGEPDALGHHLVHGDCRGEHARAGVRQTEQLERALDAAVLAMAAVQGDEAADEALALELAELALGGIERMGVDAHAPQRQQHAGARHDRDLPLGRGAAHQHRDLAQALDVDGSVAHAAFSTISTTCAGTAPIEPAPMAMTTSPAFACSRMVAGISPMSSTKTGSTLPATRKARASERPSAATIGASPAA